MGKFDIAAIGVAEQNLGDARIEYADIFDLALLSRRGYAILGKKYIAVNDLSSTRTLFHEFFHLAFSQVGSWELSNDAIFDRMVDEAMDDMFAQNAINPKVDLKLIDAAMLRDGSYSPNKIIVDHWLKTYLQSGKSELDFAHDYTYNKKILKQLKHRVLNSAQIDINQIRRSMRRLIDVDRQSYSTALLRASAAYVKQNSGAK
jgi:hypothetical protein